MSLELTEFSDSTEHLYSVLTADDDIDAEVVDAMLTRSIANQVNELFNNQEELAEQIRQQQEEAGEPAPAEE